MYVLYPSNRLEVLVEQLAALIAASGADPLEPVSVVVSSPGVGRWLRLALAERHGICAGMEFPMLGAFLWRLFRAWGGHLPEKSDFESDVLVWRISALLDEVAGTEGAEPLRRYLAGANARRRHELALRVADVFDQYFVYRPEWLAAWEKGRRISLGEDEGWQAPMWKRLVETASTPHRAALLQQFLQDLQGGDDRALPRHVFLFAPGYLPPVYHETLKVLGQKTDVSLFLLNPVREAWGDIRRGQTASLFDTLEDEASESQIGHPLLASLGRQGRVFIDQVMSAGAEEPQTVYVAPTRKTLLSRLQKDILELKAPKAGHRQDETIQFHSAHSEMREVEILHDQLLALFDAHPDLAPHDVLVMTPDIERYAPFVEAHFRSRTREGSHEPLLPFAVADRSLGGENRLHRVLGQTLELFSGRFEVDAVMALLEQPEVMESRGLTGSDMELLRRWVGEASIRWGRDATHRQLLGQPEDEAHTWREGLNRLWLGFALPRELSDWPQWQGHAPVPVVEGGKLELLATLERFVAALARWQAYASQPRSLAEWGAWLAELLATLFSTQTESPDYLELTALASELSEHADRAAYSGREPLAVLRSWWDRQGRRPGLRQAFFNGRITFSAMMPLRTLPFRVICVLGMNGGEYPRPVRPWSFDLMAQHPREGDRSRRDEDRYLFLEAALAARDVFYVSYVGQSQKDNSVRPPSAVVESLLDVVATMTGTAKREALVVHHPLQPFSHRYRAQAKAEGTGSFFTYNGAWLNGSSALPEAKPLLDALLPEPDTSWRQISLNELQRLFRSPVEWVLRERLDIDWREFDESLESSDALLPDWIASRRLQETLLEAGLKSSEDDALAWMRASGRLPPGVMGEAWQDQQSLPVHDLLKQHRDRLMEPELEACSLSVSVGPFVIDAEMPGLRQSGLVLWTYDKVRAADLWNAWLQHLVLCTARVPGVVYHTVLLGAEESWRWPEVANARDLLLEILEVYWASLRMPPNWFIKTSGEFALQLLVEKSRKKSGEEESPEERRWKARGKAADTWKGSERHTGEWEQKTLYQRLYPDPDAALDEGFMILAEKLWSPLLATREVLE